MGSILHFFQVLTLLVCGVIALVFAFNSSLIYVEAMQFLGVFSGLVAVFFMMLRDRGRASAS